MIEIKRPAGLISITYTEKELQHMPLFKEIDKIELEEPDRVCFYGGQGPGDSRPGKVHLETDLGITGAELRGVYYTRSPWRYMISVAPEKD